MSIPTLEEFDSGTEVWIDENLAGIFQPTEQGYHWTGTDASKEEFQVGVSQTKAGAIANIWGGYLDDKKGE